MAPQQKNSKKTGLEKKTTLKKTLPKKTISKKMATKTAPKRTAPKKTALISPTKRVSPTKAPSKKTPSKKTGAKVVSPMRKPLKKAALKEKIALKSAKVKLVGKKAISKSGEERGARATRRSLAKEAPDAKQPRLKKPRLDASFDLVSLLTTSARVLDIFTASGSRPLPEEASAKVAYCNICQAVVNISPKVALVDTLEKALEEGAMKNVSYQLDLQLGTSAPSASIQDILAASGTSLPTEVHAVDTEAEEEVDRV